MSPQLKRNRPLPYLKKEKGIEDECRAIGLDRRRRKFSLRDLLIRIDQINPGERVTLRKDDELFHQPLCDAGLLKLVTIDGKLTPERTDLHLDDTQINSLGQHLEELVNQLREKLKKTGS